MFDIGERELPEEYWTPPSWAPALSDLAEWPDAVERPDRAERIQACAGSAPSGWTAVELDEQACRPESLTDAELVDAVIGFEKVAAWAQAQQARVLAEFADRRPAEDVVAAQQDTASAMGRYAADEVGLALRMARGTAGALIAQAVTLRDRLPGTLGLWERGLVDRVKVRSVVDAVQYLSDDAAAAVEARVLTRAPEQTVGQLRASLRRAVIAADPVGAERRHREARRDRRVAIDQQPDGMASLWALLPAHEAVSVWEWLTRLARAMPADDPRGMDARRADLLVALVTGQLRIGSAAADVAGTDVAGADVAGAGAGGEGVPVIESQPAAPGRPSVQVVVSLTTLMGVDEEPGELAGYGPVPASVAREIASEGVWRRLVTDPVSGVVLDHGRTTYRPPPGLADLVRARDRECRSPICRRRADGCELDHVVAWEHGGTTALGNLWALCSHHHHLKHSAGWSVVLGADGGAVWTTPTGHRYTSLPAGDIDPSSVRPGLVDRAGPGQPCGRPGHAAEGRPAPGTEQGRPTPVSVAPPDVPF